ncbi:receptor-type tyrosine-protein phosphatase delta-like [Ornithodoros turicata]|uniref:receptor-type tyrosine-protein phosphatase delta-like n=1 Tax=Ornithodoros turicata TaxID=34597 RepID=UPI003139ED18
MSRQRPAVLLCMVVNLALLTVADDCPAPVRMELTAYSDSEFYYRWDSDTYMSNVWHCVCIQRGGLVENPCRDGVVAPKGCSKNENKYTHFWKQLDTYTKYTACAQRQCGEKVSRPVCLTVTTAPRAPTEPFAISLRSDTPWSIEVTWKYPLYRNGPLDGYLVSWCEYQGCPVTRSRRVEGADNRRYRIMGLVPYTTYSVSVQAYNMDRGKYLYSSQETSRVTTLCTYPSKPSLNWWCSGPFDVMVKIQKPIYPNGPIDGYRLNVCPTQRCPDDSMTSNYLESNPDSKKVANLKPWQKYTITLTAYNTKGEKKLYSEPATISVYTMPEMPSEPPTLEAAIVESRRVKLVWGYPAYTSKEVTGYQVSWCTSDHHKCYYYRQDTKKHFVVGGLKPLTAYEFKVEARLSFGTYNVPGRPATLNVTTLPGGPSKPKDVRVVQHNATFAEIAWREPDDPQGPVDGYRFMACPKGFCAVTTAYTIQRGNDTEATLTELEPYTQYAFRISAFNDLPDGNMMHGDERDLEFFTDPTVPGEPQELRARGISATSISVTWNHPERTNGPLLGYNVSWKAMGIEKRDNAIINGTAYNLTSLLPSTKYNIEVFRTNKEGNVTFEGPTAKVVGSTQPLPLPPVRNLKVTIEPHNDTQALIVNWSAPEVPLLDPLEFIVSVCRQDLSDCSEEVTQTHGARVALKAAEDLVRYTVAVTAFVQHDGFTVNGTSLNTTIATGVPEIKDFVLLNLDCCSAKFSWSPAKVKGDAVFYYLTKLTPGDEEVLSGNDSSKAVTGLMSWNNYTASIRLCLTITEQVYCGQWTSVTFRTLPSVPGRIRNVNVTKFGDGHEVSWVPPFQTNGPISGYEVTWYCPPESNFAAGVLHVTEVNARSSVALQGLKANVPCLVTVAAFNEHEGQNLVGAFYNVTFLP